jgi:anti-sigma B factor antagonist
VVASLAPEEVGVKTEQLELSVRKAAGKAPVIDLKGEVDVYTAPRFKKAMIELIDQGNFNIIVNLSNVQYMDSAGLGALVSGLKRVREHNGTINLVSPAVPVQRVLDITRLSRILNIYPNEQQAQDAIGGAES